MPYDTFYEPIARSPRTALDGAIDSVIDTFAVVDGSKLPDAPNTATIGLGEDAETVLYETKVGNILSDVTRGFDPPGSNKGWDTDTPVARVLTRQDLMALNAGIVANAGDISVNTGDIGGIESSLSINFLKIQQFLGGAITQVQYNYSSSNPSSRDTVDYADSTVYCQIVPKDAGSYMLVYVSATGVVFADPTIDEPGPSNSRRMFTRIRETVTDTVVQSRAHGFTVPASLQTEQWAHYFPITYVGLFSNASLEVKTFKLEYLAEADSNYTGVQGGAIVVAELASLYF